MYFSGSLTERGAHRFDQTGWPETPGIFLSLPPQCWEDTCTPPYTPTHILYSLGGAQPGSYQVKSMCGWHQGSYHIWGSLCQCKTKSKPASQSSVVSQGLKYFISVTLWEGICQQVACVSLRCPKSSDSLRKGCTREPGGGCGLPGQQWEVGSGWAISFLEHFACGSDPRLPRPCHGQVSRKPAMTSQALS